MVRATLDPNDPPHFTAEKSATLDALTAEEIEQNARTDADNPPFTEEELERVRLARAVQATRHASGLTSIEFARRYHIDPKQLEGWERGLIVPDATVMAYLRTIRLEPEAVERALRSPAAA